MWIEVWADQRETLYVMRPGDRMYTALTRDGEVHERASLPGDTGPGAPVTIPAPAVALPARSATPAASPPPAAAPPPTGRGWRSA